MAQLPVEDGLLLWLDATDAESLTLDGDFVDQWNDKSGNDNHAFPVFDGGAPVWTADAMNGQPSVRFAGETADGLVMEDFFLDTRPYTAFIVNQYWGDTQGRTLQGTDGNNWLLGLWNGSVGHFASGWVSNPQPLAQTNFVYVADAVGTETESSFFVNNTNFTDDSAPLGIPGSLAIGGGGSFPAEVSDSDVSEVIFYDRALSEAELGTMRTYLYEKYDVSDFATVEPDTLNVIAGSVSQFTSAADLDFAGDFAYAVNVGGPDENLDFDPLVIGDAEFIAGTNEDIDDLDSAGNGISMTVANEIAEWVAGTDYGDTEDDDNLEFAMQSIRWNVPPGVDTTMEVEAGQAYKLQMLFAEQCCDRGFDIVVEDELVVDNLLVQEIQGGIANNTAGVAYTLELTAGDSELNVSLVGGEFLGVGDVNPILNAFTLEKIEGVVGPVCDPNTLGDIDGSGDVAFADFLILSQNFGQAAADHTTGDIDCSGDVAFADFLVLSQNFGTTVGGAETVPEPSTHCLLVLAGMLGLVVRRRR